MKTKKMSLANIQDKLSRTEMKKIMAGSGGSGSGCIKAGQMCNHNDTCCGGGKCPSMEAATC